MPAAVHAKCIICTDQFWASKDICALPCGHTFHWNCSSRWIKTNKSCPNCRTKVQERNIVKQLFFEECTDDTILEGDANGAALEAKVEQLSVSLQQAKNEVIEAKEETRQIREEKDTLKDKLARSEKKVSKLIVLETENHHLHNTLEDQKSLRRELKQKEDLLKASEFFKMFSAGSEEQADRAMSKYIDANGYPDANKFLSVTKKQLVDSQQKNARFSSEIHKLEKDKQSLIKEKHDLDNIVKALKEECDHLRANQNMHTPYNPKLKRIFENAPPPRLSYGFNQSCDLNEDAFDRALRKADTSQPMRSIENVSLTSQFDATIDLFSPPSKITTSKIPSSSNWTSAPNMDDSEIFDSSDLKIPEALKQRVLSGEPLKKSNAMGVIQRSTFIRDDDLCFDRSPTIAPRPIKTAFLEKRKRQQMKSNSSTDIRPKTLTSFFGAKRSKTTLSPLKSLDTKSSYICLDD